MKTFYRIKSIKLLEFGVSNNGAKVTQNVVSTSGINL